MFICYRRRRKSKIFGVTSFNGCFPLTYLVVETVLEHSFTLEGSTLNLHRVIPDDSPEVRYESFVCNVSPRNKIRIIS